MMNKIGNGILGLSTHEQDALLTAYDVIKTLCDTFKHVGIDMLEKSSTGEIIETDELLRVQAILEGLGSDKLSDWAGYKEEVENLSEDEDEDEEDWEDEDEDENEEEDIENLIRAFVKKYHL